MKNNHFTNQDNSKQNKKANKSDRKETRLTLTIPTVRNLKRTFQLRVNIVMAFINILSEIRSKGERRDKIEMLRKGLERHGTDRQDKE